MADQDRFATRHEFGSRASPLELELHNALVRIMDLEAENASLRRENASLNTTVDTFIEMDFGITTSSNAMLAKTLMAKGILCYGLNKDPLIPHLRNERCPSLTRAFFARGSSSSVCFALTQASAVVAASVWDKHFVYWFVSFTHGSRHDGNMGDEKRIAAVNEARVIFDAARAAGFLDVPQL